MLTSTSLKEIEKVIALTDRVKLRKHDYLSATPHICAERSRLLTESYKQSDGEPRDIRKAKGFKKVLEAIPVVIREGELIVGSQSQYIRGAHPPLEWNPHHVLELFEGMDMRLSGVASMPAEISEEEKASLLEDVTYWRGKTATDSIRNIQRELYKDMDDLLEARITHDAGMGRVTSSKIADYGKVIEKGLNGVIAEAKERLQGLSFSVEGDSDRYYFLQAVVIACEGVLTFSQRYAELAKDLAMRETDAARKRELEKIAEICQRVPANSAHSFHEALQSFWFTHLCINLEHAYDTETPGRMDQYLYPFYQRDVEAGRLTRQEAAELLGCLWVKLTEMEGIKGKVWKAAAQSSQFQDVTIGGVTRDGKDATNELTYLLLEVTRQVKVVQPPLYLRCHKGTPEELWMKGLEVNRDRKDGNPAFVSDQAVVLNFAAKGIPIREARDWAPGGCVHPHVSHASTGDRAMFLNLAKILELTFNNGKDPRTKKQLGAATGDPRSFSSFDELYHAYKNQVVYFVELFVKYHNFYWQVRKNYYSLPFFSALMDDCIMKGIDYLAGGCRYPQLYYNFYDRGHQNVADSLVAVKKLVFEDRKISMDHLLKALEANFEGDGNEDILQMVLAAPKYGNDDDYADDVFNDFSLWLQRRLNEEKHPLGENSRSIRGGATHHFYAGETVGALPDGRKAWQPLADGSLSPVQGRDKKGPTATINSATKVNHTEVNTSTLFNLKFMPSILQSRAGLQKLVGLIKTYFDRGGYHVQFNLMGQEVLREAKKRPDQYRDLLVRVAGYSAYFTELAPEVQDEIIARTEQAL